MSLRITPAGYADFKAMAEALNVKKFFLFDDPTVHEWSLWGLTESGGIGMDFAGNDPEPSTIMNDLHPVVLTSGVPGITVS